MMAVAMVAAVMVVKGTMGVVLGVVEMVGVAVGAVKKVVV